MKNTNNKKINTLFVKYDKAIDTTQLKDIDIEHISQKEKGTTTIKHTPKKHTKTYYQKLIGNIQKPNTRKTHTLKKTTTKKSINTDGYIETTTKTTTFKIKDITPFKQTTYTYGENNSISATVYRQLTPLDYKNNTVIIQGIKSRGNTLKVLPIVKNGVTPLNDLNLNSDTKILTYGISSMGVTDNIKRNMVDTLGHPYLRYRGEYCNIYSKDKQIHTTYIQFGKYVYTNNELSKKEYKKLLDTTFISRVVKLYYGYMQNQQHKTHLEKHTKNKKKNGYVPKFKGVRYSRVVKSLKVIDGDTLLEYLNTIIQAIENNETFFKLNNGLNEYSLGYLKEIYNDISKNAYLGEYKTIKDTHNHKNKVVWVDKEYSLSTKTHRQQLKNHTQLKVNKPKELLKWLHQNSKINNTDIDLLEIQKQINTPFKPRKTPIKDNTPKTPIKSINGKILGYW